MKYTKFLQFLCLISILAPPKSHNNNHVNNAAASDDSDNDNNEDSNNASAAGAGVTLFNNNVDVTHQNPPAPALATDTDTSRFLASNNKQELTDNLTQTLYNFMSRLEANKDTSDNERPKTRNFPNSYKIQKVLKKLVRDLISLELSLDTVREIVHDILLQEKKEKTPSAFLGFT